MKNIIFAIFAVVVALFSGINVFAAEKQFVIVGDSYPPYSYIENNEFKGTDVDIIKAVFERLKIKPLFKFRPWARAIAEVKSGRSDAIYSLFRTKEREAYLTYPVMPLSYEKNILVVNDDSDKTAKSLEDIKGWRIGVVTENSYGKSFDEYKDVYRVESISNELLVLQLDAKKRFDAIIINELLFDTIVNRFVAKGEIKNPAFRKLEYVPNNAPLYMGFSKKSLSEHKDIVERFSDALFALNNEGVVDKIMNQYSNQTTMKETTVTE
jgi:polar amino acid transport system substrate-binding protein